LVEYIIKFDKDDKELMINSVVDASKSEYEKIIREFDSVFSDKLGKYKGCRVKLHLKEGTKPVYCKPYPVPYALQEKIEKEINRLVEDDVFEAVESSEWATPVVPVLKSNGQVRLCGNYKITVNPQLKVDRYPVPRVSDVETKLSKGTVFTKIDLSHAYQQLELEELDEKSRDIVTVNTHKGLFRPKRLKDGIASAPGLFIREMDNMVGKLNGVAAFFDDVYISGENMCEHDENLRKVLIFREKGITINKNKCEFAKAEINLLGYVFSEKGRRVSNKAIESIQRMKVPEDVKELQSFIGMINYYSQFCEDFAKIMVPLYELLKDDTKWDWTERQMKAFQNAKQMLCSAKVLTHYDSKLQIKITCDASPNGLDAVISHIFPNGTNRPIAFASRVLRKAERNYSQIDKEALALVFGVQKFHQYIYGRQFILETDHKPLLYIFGPKKGIPQMSANRLQRYAVFLSRYDFEIKYIKEKNNISA